MTAPFNFSRGKLPLLVSIPHAGTALTPEVESSLSDAARPLPDTDWHIPKLYEFAHALGASVIVGNYSRMVIDLNRPADDKPLYTTATTGLYPETLFDGTAVFIPGKEPNTPQRKAALDTIWQPYHQQLQSELERMKAEHGYALLFDAHSIASHIPRLFDGKLPDLNFGTNGGKSCDELIEEHLVACAASQNQFSWVANGRFKGGYITRAYGQPSQGVHAVQLELAQCNYMDEQPPFAWREERAEKLQPLLEQFIRSMLSSAQQIA
ncbi:Predicted N-formylglutamate amidohydrolase [Buttiauxella agrestis]|uniref:Predicted N-formylglutamate amidohydrolase n=1 Tax=Buttiauxella agrestis TaxID=82977 RepID=A0A381C8Y5_9ENTR|nr:N-formylglutamate deformylase [Buttiauxella agrestis]SUW64358.1 Predicted N-formylglutamate amidohydrolase [Buttiauxella agrestis]